MDRNLTLGVTIALKDGLSGPSARAMSSLSSETAKMARAQRTEYERLSKARESLGIRSEHVVQREIQRTEAAYRRLASSGTLSFTEQARAAEQMRRKITALTNEMGKLTTAQKLAAGGRAVVGGAAGIAAGAYMLKAPVEKAMAYDLRLAHMANTAFADRDAAGRKSGAQDLNKAIVEAIQKGGGNRDQAAETLNALISSGAMSVGDASTLLPTLMKSATASEADATALAQIAIRGMQTFKIKPAELPNVIDMAIAAGQAGGFELKDMAKWLPQQMAAASASGLSGTAGFAKLAALNQAAVITAGSKDEAGNNLVNLLAKINSSDTAKDAEKLGINLPKRLATDRAKGIDSVDSFVGLVNEQVSKHTAWKQLQEKLKNTKDDSEKRETLESMAAIVQGSSVGQLVQDRQALMALVGIMNNGEYLQDVQAKTLNSAGAADRNFSVISDTASFKTGQVANEKEIAQQKVMDKLTPSIGSLADKTVELAREFPGLTTATVAATGALTALAAAAGAAGLAGTLTGGGVAGSAGRIIGATGGMLRTAGRFGLKRALPLWGAWEAGQWAGENIANPVINSGISWATGRENSLGGLIYDLTHREPTQVGGEIRVRVDQDGRVTSVSGTTTNPRVPINVDGGIMMMNP